MAGTGSEKSIRVSAQPPSGRHHYNHLVSGDSWFPGVGWVVREQHEEHLTKHMHPDSKKSRLFLSLFADSDPQ